MTGRIILRGSLTNGEDISPFKNITVGAYEIMVRNVRPIAVFPHSPGLNIFYKLGRVFGGVEAGTLMVNCNANRYVLTKWLWLGSIPGSPRNDAKLIGLCASLPSWRASHSQE